MLSTDATHSPRAPPPTLAAVDSNTSRPCCGSGCDAAMGSSPITPPTAIVADGNAEESSSPAVCERGCLLVDGICPITEEEWRQAVEQQRTAKAEAEQRIKTAPKPTPITDAEATERRVWQQRAVLLSLLTIAYCVAEGSVGLALGAKNVSVSLLALGADSWVEVVSACLVCYRFYGDLRRGGDAAATPQTATRKERLATRAIGLLLCLLSAAVVAGSVAALVTHEPPESDVPNIAVGAAGVVLLSVLYTLKLRVAVALKSSTVEADAQCSLFCVGLSLVLLVGAIVFKEAPSVWWFDSATAIVLALLIAREGYGAVVASAKEDFTGGGCGCEGGKEGWAMRWMRQRINAGQQPEEAPCAGIQLGSHDTEPCCAKGGPCSDQKGTTGDSTAACEGERRACGETGDGCCGEVKSCCPRERRCGSNAAECAGTAVPSSASLSIGPPTFDGRCGQAPRSQKTCSGETRAAVSSCGQAALCKSPAAACNAKQCSGGGGGGGHEEPDAG